MDINIKNISIRLLGFASASLMLSACASSVWDEVNLMAALEDEAGNQDW
jgi:hypothetical protein